MHFFRAHLINEPSPPLCLSEELRVYLHREGVVPYSVPAGAPPVQSWQPVDRPAQEPDRNWVERQYFRDPDRETPQQLSYVYDQARGCRLSEAMHADGFTFFIEYWRQFYRTRKY